MYFTCEIFSHKSLQIQNIPKFYRSFAKDNGSSQATANATDGGDANAVAKSNGK